MIKDKYLSNLRTPSFSINDPAIGVITGTDEFTFDGLQVLYASLKGKVQFLCYDLGMKQDQLEWCKQQNLCTKSSPVQLDQTIKHWQTLSKPWLVKDSPFEYTVWIDTVCIVIGDLSKADLITNKRTFFTKHWIHQHLLLKNKPCIYERFPLETKNVSHINAGVLGINKTTHSFLLDDWIHVLDSCIKNPELLDGLASADEGGLTWALQKLDDESIIVDDYRYNHCSMFSDSNVRKIMYQPYFLAKAGVYPPSFFSQLQNAQESFILHFSTQLKNEQKYWNMWPH